MVANVAEREDVEIVTKRFYQALICQTLSRPMFEKCLLSGVSIKKPYQGTNPYNGYTPLHIAASTGQENVCQWLLEQGVSVNITTEYGETPMDKAAKSGKFILVKSLKAQGGTSRYADEQTAKLHQIINREDITDEDDSVKQEYLNELTNLILQGADVNGVNKTTTAARGELPLHTLFIKGNCLLIEHFLTLGADPKLTDHNSETPLQRLLRIGKNKERVLQFLTKYYPELVDKTKNDSQVNSPVVFFAGSALKPAAASAPSKGLNGPHC